MISRRQTIVGLAAGGACAWRRTAHAQRVYRIEVLIHGTARTQGNRLNALRAALREHGYTEGRNLSLSVRWNEGGLELLPDLAADLLRENPDVFVCAP